MFKFMLKLIGRVIGIAIRCVLIIPSIPLLFIASVGHMISDVACMGLKIIGEICIQTGRLG
jgi:hypothetical protein